MATDRQIEGAGVIVDARNGLIVTNNHVIEHAEEILVDLADQRRLRAALVSADPHTDIPVIKIVAADLAALPYGDSDKLEVGDYVLAVGTPFGMGQTVTHGIVSALHRSGLRLNGYQDFVQADAPINRGNSGGALISLRGELAGPQRRDCRADGG